MAIVSRASFRQARTGGELVKVQIKPGVFMKIYKDEAIERGLWPPEKAETPAKNKRRSTSANKAASTE